MSGIIEYKRATNENVINGFILLGLVTRSQGGFPFPGAKKFGDQEADKIDWSAPRLICIAGDFTRYVEHAIQQINRSIEFIRYRRFGDDLLLLELVNAVTVRPEGLTSPPSFQYVIQDHHRNPRGAFRAVTRSI